VQLLPCQPLAQTPVNGQKPAIGGKNRTENGCSARPWGRQALILVNKSGLLVECLGQLANILRDSAVYTRIKKKKKFTPKRNKNKTDLPWGFPELSPVQSPD
jgi:hypothetical protein